MRIEDCIQDVIEKIIGSTHSCKRRRKKGGSEGFELTPIVVSWPRGLFFQLRLPNIM